MRYRGRTKSEALTETCGRCDTDQTRDDAGAEANQAKLLGVDDIQDDPAYAATTGCKVGVDDDVYGSQAQVGSAGAVKGKPSEPDEDGALYYPRLAEVL